MRGFHLHTVCEPEEWAWTGRRRVLVESPDAWAIRPKLAAAGYEVATCRGPTPYDVCPLLLHGSCATASAAHAIVCEVGGGIADALTDAYPQVQVHRSVRSLLH
jgi:hypothetical protein